MRRADRDALHPRGGRRSRRHRQGGRGLRHRLLHRVFQQSGLRGVAGPARPGAFARHRRQAHPAGPARLHRSGRRRHGQRGPAGGRPRCGPRRAGHLFHVEQRGFRRDRRPHDRDHRARPAHQEHARRPRRRSARLSDPDEQSAGRIGGRRLRCPRRRQQPRERQPHQEDDPAGAAGSAAEAGILVRRDPHDVPDRVVHRDHRGARLPDRQDAAVHAMGVLKDVEAS